MKQSMRTLLILAGLVNCTAVFAQLKVSTKTGGDATTGKQIIQATVTGGSGQYTYAWGIVTPGLVPENSSVDALLVPTQDAEYIVFVRDKKTGATAYSSAFVKTEVDKEAHFLRLPGEGNGSKYRYFPTGALQRTSPKK